MLRRLKLSQLILGVLLIFVLACALRIYSISSGNVIIGFDQARDLFLAKTIWTDKDIKIIGPTAGNNPNLHHGVLWLYFILPAVILFKGNVFYVAFWNAIFNAMLVIVLFVFAKELFTSKRAGIVAAILAASSFYLLSYAGWLSNPSPTLTTVPLVFLGFWHYINHKKWGLVMCLFFLGLTIEFELFFIYLIPTLLLMWLIFRPKFPDWKLLVLSISGFVVATSTMILTEIKYSFSGVGAILFAGRGVQQHSDYSYVASYVARFFNTIAQTVFPARYGFIFGIVIMSFLVYVVVVAKYRKENTPSLIFLLIYLCSSSIMLLLGYHTAPWFLIGVPPAAILATAFMLSKIKSNLLLSSILIFGLVLNMMKVADLAGLNNLLLEPDKAAILAKQLQAIDFTYSSSQGEKFTINTLTNPLYVNAVWAWQYDSYARHKYGYLPSFSGGDQLYPYHTLTKFSELDFEEKYLYLLIDTTPRIPSVHTLLMRKWADERSVIVETKDFDGILVEKRELLKVAKKI